MTLQEYLHPVELLDGVGIALGVLQLEGAPLGLLHEGGGRSDEQNQHGSAHGDQLEEGGFTGRTLHTSHMHMFMAYG